MQNFQAIRSKAYDQLNVGMVNCWQLIHCKTCNFHSVEQITLFTWQCKRAKQPQNAKKNWCTFPICHDYNVWNFIEELNFCCCCFYFNNIFMKWKEKFIWRRKVCLFVEIGVDWGLSAVNRERVTCGHHSSNLKCDPMELNVKKANGSCIEMAKVHCMQFSMAFHVKIRFKLDFQVKMNSFGYCWNSIVNTAQEHKKFEAYLVFSTKKFNASFQSWFWTVFRRDF